MSSDIGRDPLTQLDRWWNCRQADVVASDQNILRLLRNIVPERIKKFPVTRCSESGDEVWVRSVDDDDENPDHIEDQIPLKVACSISKSQLGPFFESKVADSQVCLPTTCDVLRFRVWIV